jgi:hypothetical protein
VNFPVPVVDTLLHRVLAPADIFQFVSNEVRVDPDLVQVQLIGDLEPAVREIRMLVEKPTIGEVELKKKSTECSAIQRP